VVDVVYLYGDKIAAAFALARKQGDMNLSMFIYFRDIFNTLCKPYEGK